MLLCCHDDPVCLAVDILWHFLCGGLSACWIPALAGFGGWVVAVCGCCLGCMWGACACFVAAWWVVFASDLHCVVVSIEMMPGLVSSILLACVPLNLASWLA